MKKKLLKDIRFVANQLPDIYYNAYPKEIVDQKDKLGNTFIHEPKLIESRKVKHLVNHYRRIKRLTEAYGFDEAVKMHVEWCGNLLKKHIKVGVKKEIK